MQGDLEGVFHAAFKTMSDAAFAVDNENKVVAGNAAFASMFGLSATELTELSLDQLCLDADERAKSTPLTSSSPEQAVVRHRYRRSDGTIFWGERSRAPIQGCDGSCLGAFSIIRDVTDRVSLERGLASLLALPLLGSDEAHHSIAKLLDLGRRHFDVEHGSLGRIEGGDYVIEIVSGSLGQHEAGDKLPLKDTFAALQRDQDGVLAIERCTGSQFSEHRYFCRTGFEFYLAGEVWIAGRLYGTLNFADRTSRSRRLQGQDRLFLRLIARWIGMLLEIRMTRAALSATTYDLERFTYIASHDLQEPLRRVVTYCQILMEDFGAEVSDEAAEVIEVIQTGGKRMRLMLNDLLVYSRLDQQLQKAFEPVDMASVLCHAIDDLSEKMEASGACVNSVPLPIVWGHVSPLQMVCYHLLSNAIKFAGDRPPKIDIAIQDQGRFWQFSVTDQGIGVEPRFADRIFDMFQRLHPRDDFSGSGAGLAICKLVVERYGGAIWFDTSCQDGTRFLFTLPKDRWAANSLMGSLNRLPFGS